MENNSIAKYVTRFFQDYLMEERGVSANTIRSYRDTFTQFLRYYSRNGKSPHEIIPSDINRDMIVNFLNQTENIRGIKAATRNQRLAALHSFAKFMTYEDVVNMAQWQSILEIKVKKAEKPHINYISIEGMRFLLAQISSSTKEGRRDIAMLCFLYDSAVRVQELVDLTPSCINFISPCHVVITGKGRKKRNVPLLDAQIAHLKSYMKDYSIDNQQNLYRPLFRNNRGGKFTTAGVSYILQKYTGMAHLQRPDIIPARLTPHCIRHTKAMHLLQAGCELYYIKDILGHESIRTTEIYAKADSKMKREALEQVYVDVVPEKLEEPSWQTDSKLMNWLKNLGK